MSTTSQYKNESNAWIASQKNAIKYGELLIDTLRKEIVLLKKQLSLEQKELKLKKQSLSNVVLSIKKQKI